MAGRPVADLDDRSQNGLKVSREFCPENLILRTGRMTGRRSERPVADLDDRSQNSPESNVFCFFLCACADRSDDRSDDRSWAPSSAFFSSFFLTSFFHSSMLTPLIFFAPN